jgi:hypothetical protein
MTATRKRYGPKMRRPDICWTDALAVVLVFAAVVALCAVVIR